MKNKLLYSKQFTALFIALSVIFVLSTACEKTKREEFEIRISGKHEHPDLHNPTDIVFFKGKFVATELYKNRLAYFDDLEFTNLQHFNPQSIGKRFQSPHFLAVSPWNTLLISNGWGRSIVEIENLDGKGWKQFSGIGKAFYAPHGICVDKEGWIYVGDSLNSRLVRFKDMDGKDWQVFKDHDKKIAYIRELVCRDDAVWISNSYENRKGLNKGTGANVLKLSDFESGRVEEIYKVPESNITGIIPLNQSLITNLFAKPSTRQTDISQNPAETKEIVKLGAISMGVPYGTFSMPEDNLYLSAFFGEFNDKSNLGGILSMKKVPANQPDGITWTMIDVNNTTLQGDSHLVQVKGGKTILIDTGFPQLTVSQVIPYLTSNNISVLNGVYATHAHMDHFGGLESIVGAGIKIEKAWFNPLNEQMCAREPRCYFDKYKRAQKILADHGAEVSFLKTGDVHDLGQGANLNVIYAFDGISTPVNSRDVNDTSAILRVDYSGYKFLFTGDLNRKMGYYLAHNAKNIKADVLKVPHHGAEGLAPNIFFEKVKPRFALVPAPSHLWQSDRSKRVREWFQSHNTPVFVNGISGHVQVIVNNGVLSIEEQVSKIQKDAVSRTLKTTRPNIDDFQHRGHIDKITCQHKQINIYGWAPWKGFDRGQTLYLMSSHKVDKPLLLKQQRPDVVKAFNDPQLQNSGFHLKYHSDRSCDEPDPLICLIAEEPKTGEFFLLHSNRFSDACNKLL